MNMKRLMIVAFILGVLPFTLSAGGGQEAKAAGPATIVFQSIADPRETAAVTELIEKYKSVKPEITVEYRPFSGGLNDMEAKLLLNLSSGVGDPDIFVTQYSSGVTFAAAGWLEWIPAQFASTVESNLAHPGLKKPCVFEGQWYGLPHSLGTFILAYNKDHFQEAGLSDGPKDYDQLIDYAKKLTMYDAGGNMTRSGLYFRKSGHGHGNATKWNQFYYAWGGKTPLFDEKSTYFNNQAAKDSLQYYLDAIYKHKVDSFNVEGDMNGLGKGTTSMIFRAPGAVILLETRYPDLNYGAFSVPKQVKSATMLSGVVSCVNKYSKNKAAVWDFLQWFFQPEHCVELAKSRGHAILKQNLSDPFFEREMYVVENRQNVEHPESVYSDPMMAGSYEGLMAIGRQVENVCYKKVSIAEALNAAEKDVQEVIEKHHQ